MIYKCILCDYVTESRRSLPNHIHSSHHLKSKDFYDKYYKTDEEGICQYCHKQTKFKNMFVGYNAHCCVRCSSLDPNVQNKNKQTNSEKYEYETPLVNPEVRQTMFTDEAKQKRKIHIKETFNNKYGGHPMRTEAVKQKCAETNKKKYGGSTPTSSSQVTKKIRRTANKKLKELECYNYLCTKYKEVIREYKSELYPYKCDFYIKDINMYIELYLFWMHGGHRYNSDDINDQKTLDYWKSKNTDIYKRAIDIWTNKDIIKYTIAKQNKLNYQVFYSLNDFYDFFNKEEINHGHN